MHSYILMQSDDFKARAWSEVADSLGVRLVPMPGSAMYIPVRILRHLFADGKPQAVVFRYLNDYPSLSKTLLRTLSELTSVVLCLLLRARIVWICHNVDRESVCFHPTLSSVRRWILSRSAEFILVTDPELVKHAQAVFPSQAQKVDYTTFGAVLEPSTNPEDDSTTQLIIDFINERKHSAQRPTLVGLSAGHAQDKTIHFKATKALLESANDLGYEVAVVVVGPIGRFLKEFDAETLEFLKTDKRVLFIDRFVAIDEVGLSSKVDFYWRGYDDLSVPFTVYNAASVKVPMLVQDRGFLAEIVRQYSLGAVISDDWTNLAEAMAAIQEWDGQPADDFLSTHNWKVGTSRLLRACGVDVA